MEKEYSLGTKIKKQTSQADYTKSYIDGISPELTKEDIELLLNRTEQTNETKKEIMNMFHPQENLKTATICGLGKK